MGTPHMGSSCHPLTTSLLNVLPLFPLHSVLALCFLLLPLHLSFLSLLYLFFFVPSLSYTFTQSSYMIHGRVEEWEAALHGHREQHKAPYQAFCPLPFSSLPFIFFTLSCIFVVLEIEAKAMWMVGRFVSLVYSLSPFEMEFRYSEIQEGSELSILPPSIPEC